MMEQPTHTNYYSVEITPFQDDMLDIIEHDEAGNVRIVLQVFNDQATDLALALMKQVRGYS